MYKKPGRLGTHSGSARSHGLKNRSDMATASNSAARLRGASGNHPRRFTAVFAVVAVGIAMVNLDLLIVNVALPSIGRSFGGTGLDSLSWS